MTTPNPEAADAARAIIGHDFLSPDADHPTYGITITNAWLDVRGMPQPHGNMIEVYRDKAIRDRVLYLLQTHGLADEASS